MTTESVAPNTLDGAAQQHNAIPGLDTIATKMAAMRQEAQRNRLTAIQPAATGTSEQANADEPVAPPQEPEIDSTPESLASDTEDIPAQDSPAEPVSAEDSAETNAQDIIDFIEFAESNPNAKFKFIRNGKEMVIDAKKAAAILGQGGAIHEDARELKIKRSEFEEYERDTRQRQEGLLLAMEFTIQPQLQSAYDEIIKTQGYQATFQQQLATTQDPAMQARIRASMEQNERYIQQQGDTIRHLKPRVDQFYDARRQQVQSVLESNRKAFKDKELKNEYVYKEIREKITKDWPAAREQLVPGVENIDLIVSDEYVLGLIRDGFKFRDKPQSRAAGASIAQLQNRKGSTAPGRDDGQDLSRLREQAKGRGKEATQAADNLLVAQLQRLRTARSR